MSSPIQWPCGKPGQPPCPPIESVVTRLLEILSHTTTSGVSPSLTAGLRAVVSEEMMKHGNACFNAGIAKKTAEYELAMQEIPDTTQD